MHELYGCGTEVSSCISWYLCDGVRAVRARAVARARVRPMITVQHRKRRFLPGVGEQDFLVPSYL